MAIRQENRTEAEGSAATRQPAGWRAWFPGLDNVHLTLREVLATLPAAPPAAIPWVVRLFENPQGWLPLHGAVDLATHDRIHVVLGRGLLAQDEAFVIGFTMGSTKAVSRLERWFFKCTVSHLYPAPYRIPWPVLAAYDLGIEAGRDMGVKDIHRCLGDEMLDCPLGKVRRLLGIDPLRLRRFYAREREALPESTASRRLPMPGKIATRPPGVHHVSTYEAQRKNAVASPSQI